MIDQFNITKFNRTDAELEEFLLFAIVVAGKTASTQVRLLEKFLSQDSFDWDATPLEKIHCFAIKGLLLEKLKNSGLGQYNKLWKSFTELTQAVIIDRKLNLRTCSIEELRAITGIGPKTARFFLLHSRPDQKLCVIDTHVLKFMREQKWTNLLSTPSDKMYQKLEKIYCDYLNSLGITDFAAYDLGLWTKYTKNKPVSGALQSDGSIIPLTGGIQKDEYNILVRGNN